jgi:signal transduction histidine kinase
MRLYTSLSKIKYLDKSYAFKYMFISFLGVHIPLIGIIAFVLISGINSMSPQLVIECVLVFTLIACAMTLLVQNALAKPITITKNALINYLNTKTLPQLPVNFKDEVGLLMSNTNTALYELDNLIKEKRDFIYLLSHDLKTPLHNVITLVQLMQEDYNNGSKDEYLHLIRQSTRHQIQMIGTVLDLATSDFTSLANPTTINLDQVMNRIVKDLFISLKNKELQILIDIPLNMKLTVNEDLFCMALTNLVINAIKFSNRNSDIMVRAVEMKDHVMIRVIDYGIGFTASRAPSFEPFFKASRPGTVGEVSNGLGLYFTKKIITYHGGTITAESDGEGKGAKFIVKIPKTAV